MTSEVSCPHPSGKSVRTLCEAFQLTVALDPDRVAIRTVGDAQRFTWREYADRVRKIAAGLAALGVGHGDTVALMLTNRPEYELVDTAALHLVAIPFSVYNTSSPTMQLKRRPISDKYASEIADLYAPALGPHVVDLHV